MDQQEEEESSSFPLVPDRKMLVGDNDNNNNNNNDEDSKNDNPRAEAEEAAATPRTNSSPPSQRRRRRRRRRRTQQHRKLDDDEANTNNNNNRLSAIRYVERTVPVRTSREGRLMSLLPLTRIDDKTNQRILIDFRVYVEVSAFLAFKHIQRRSGPILHFLPRSLETCDFTWTFKAFDTQFSPIKAATHLFKESSTGVGGSNSTRSSSSFFSPRHQQQEQEDDAYQIQQQQSLSQASTEITANNPMSSSRGGEHNNDDHNISPPSDRNHHVRDLLTFNFTYNEENDGVILGDSPVVVNEENEDNDKDNDEQEPQQQQQEEEEEEEGYHDDDHQPPFALMGAARSVVSQSIGWVGSALDLPQISSSSTASSLDDLDMFARTIPTNDGDAHAAVAYLHHLGVQQFGVLLIKNVWGRKFEQDLYYHANRYNLTMQAFPYEYLNTGGDGGGDNNNNDDYDDGYVMTSLRRAKASGLRYFFGVLDPSTWKPVVRKAYQIGLMGHPDYQWFLGDLVELVGDSFVLDRETEDDIAQALHGLGVVFLNFEPNRAFDRAFAAFADNPSMQQEFIDSHDEPQLFDNYTFVPFPGRSIFQYTTYDAVIAMGLAACNAPGLFTGTEFYNQLLQIEFEGVSGTVQFNNKTGTRLAEGMLYQVVNLKLQDFLDGTTTTTTTTRESSRVVFKADTTAIIDLAASLETPNAAALIEEVNGPFIYNDNTTVPPAFLPPPEDDLNLIPPGVLAFGLSIAAIVMLLSVACAVWTYIYRDTYVIKAAQPIFLILICLGTFIVASTIILLSFQEPMPGLDIACACIPWCFCIGFTIAIAALFSKAHRINKLMLQSGTTLRRVKIKPSDVMKPFLALLSINVVLLTAWTASPWRMSWHRTDLNSVDEFGRNVESYGICRSDSNLALIFMLPLGLANFAVLVIATYESYRGRKLPNDFSECRYLALALLSLCETFVLGTTTIIAVLDQPKSFFLVLSLVLTVGCLSILVPVFLPKYMQRHKKETSINRRKILSDYSGMGKYSFAAQSSKNIKSGVFSSSGGLTSGGGSQRSSRNVLSQGDSLSRSLHNPNSHHSLRSSQRSSLGQAYQLQRNSQGPGSNEFRVSRREGSLRSGELTTNNDMDNSKKRNTSFRATLSRQGSAFFASEPQPVRRISREGSTSDRNARSSGGPRTFSAESAPGNIGNRFVPNFANQLDKSSTHSLPVKKQRRNSRNLGSLSEHFSYEEHTA